MLRWFSPVLPLTPSGNGITSSGSINGESKVKEDLHKSLKTKKYKMKII